MSVCFCSTFCFPSNCVNESFSIKCSSSLSELSSIRAAVDLQNSNYLSVYSFAPQLPVYSHPAVRAAGGPQLAHALHHRRAFHVSE